MPKILDIANITVGKQRFADTRKGLFTLRTTLPSDEPSLKTRLRTTLTVINEGASKNTKFQMPAESRGTFASWRDSLNREPIYDLYESQPLNQVKNTDKEDIEELMLEIKHRGWLKGIGAKRGK